ncbi:MAG: hypothetical protein ACPGKS_02480 [Coraliomargarita sp.]
MQVHALDYRIEEPINYRAEENAYMVRVAGPKDTRIIELDGYDHGMERPAYPLLLKEVRRILAEANYTEVSD